MKAINIIPITLMFFLAFNQEIVQAKLIKNVPHIQQKPELPRGCEVTSFAMMLQYAEINVSKMTLAEKIKKVPFWDDGFRGDPNQGFVGNMYTFSKSGYGVYNGPIFDLGKQYLPDRMLNLTMEPVEKIYEMIDLGSPVWVITTVSLGPLPDWNFTTWKTKNGEVKITYSEHSVVVTGYNADYVYVNDPLYDKANRKVNRDSFEAAWEQMGSQAVSFIPSDQKYFFDTRDHWAKSAISYVYAKGYMRGKSDYLFGPDEAVTRGQLAATLVNYLPQEKLEKKTAVNFQDIKGHWAENSIKRLALAGYLPPGIDRNFRPNQPVSRAEFAVIIDKVLELQVALFIPYQDIAQDFWASTAIQRVRTANIMTGTATQFYPNRDLKRGELATILKRMDSYAEMNEE
ncbi:C39 family peptidase [Aquibacillus salsiterrae]|uniref:C39 family peptidase n=1 Tax=Aquibacillus salsiterrae TaxID=2950439 RepID=A0A9X3WCA4_9BACI|nr:C39 family peptidase [Aquibacillus salsiterrae]MDC3415953.1 C39 family peptidase [Aquibacillus salsiterrae]